MVTPQSVFPAKNIHFNTQAIVVTSNYQTVLGEIGIS